MTVSCPANNPYTLDATVAVTSNGQGGTLSFSWFGVNPNGAEQPAGTTSADIATGQTSESVTSSEAFGSYSQDSPWGVTVTSTPAAGSGQGATSTITPAIPNNCLPDIQ